MSFYVAIWVGTDKDDYGCQAIEAPSLDEAQKLAIRRIVFGHENMPEALDLMIDQYPDPSWEFPVTLKKLVVFDVARQELRHIDPYDVVKSFNQKLKERREERK